MNISMFDILVYILGFVGLMACSLIPVRSWFILRGTIFLGELNIRNFLAPKNIALWVIIFWALFTVFQVVLRIFRCLNTTYCGPSIASGWIYLAILGATYLMFEIGISIFQGLRNKKQ